MSQKKLSGNDLLKKLDHAVQKQMKPSVIGRAHKELLDYMFNERNAAPDWDAYPIGRDFWLQFDPVNER